MTANFGLSQGVEKWKNRGFDISDRGVEKKGGKTVLYNGFFSYLNREASLNRQNRAKRRLLAAIRSLAHKGMTGGGAGMDSAKNGMTRTKLPKIYQFTSHARGFEAGQGVAWHVWVGHGLAGQG